MFFFLFPDLRNNFRVTGRVKGIIVIFVNKLFNFCVDNVDDPTIDDIFIEF